MGTPTAYLVHALPGRARIKVAGRRGDRVFFAEVEKTLRRRPEVSRVTVSPPASSLLILHEGPLSRILDFCAAEGLFALSGPGVPPLAAEWRRVVRTTEDRLKRGAGGDLAAAASLVFLGLAAVQAARGRLLAPALSLLWYGFSLLGVGRNGQTPGPSE